MMRRPRGFNTYMEWERGFRGWLMIWFLTVCVGLIAHVLNLVAIGRTSALWWPVVGARATLVRGVVVMNVVWGIGILAALVHGLTLFLQEDPATPRFWARYYLVIAVFGTAMYVLNVYRIAVWRDELVRHVLAEQGWRHFVSGTGVPLVWAVYWMRSKRVKSTYPPGRWRRDAGRFRPPRERRR